jgi:plasmid maintenance system antidote protein VapI
MLNEQRAARDWRKGEYERLDTEAKRIEKELEQLDEAIEAWEAAQAELEKVRHLCAAPASNDDEASDAGEDEDGEQAHAQDLGDEEPDTDTAAPSEQPHQVEAPVATAPTVPAGSLIRQLNSMGWRGHEIAEQLGMTVERVAALRRKAPALDSEVEDLERLVSQRRGPDAPSSAPKREEAPAPKAQAPSPDPAPPKAKRKRLSKGEAKRTLAQLEATGPSELDRVMEALERIGMTPDDIAEALDLTTADVAEMAAGARCSSKRRTAVA